MTTVRSPNCSPKRSTTFRVVAIVTAHHDPQWATRAAQAGASTFIPKDGTLAEMIDLLSRARHGQMLIGSTTFLNRPYQPAPPDEHRLPLLSHRELDVLGYLNQGIPVAGMARALGLSVHTCRGYMKTPPTPRWVCGPSWKR